MLGSAAGDEAPSRNQAGEVALFGRLVTTVATDLAGLVAKPTLCRMLAIVAFALVNDLPAGAGARRATSSRGRGDETEGGKQDGTGEQERGDEFHLGISLV